MHLRLKPTLVKPDKNAIIQLLFYGEIKYFYNSKLQCIALSVLLQL